MTNDEAKALGGRWGQDAVFLWTAHAWVVLPCGQSGEQLLGWTTEVVLEPLPDPIAERPAAERQSAQRAQAAREVRARDKAAHTQQVSAGWPVSWRPANVSHFMIKGGSAALAQTFDRAGWRPDEVSELLDALTGSEAGTGLRPPDGPAAMHRLHHDTLAELRAGVWPAVPPGTVLSVRRTKSSGQRERWVISAIDGSHVVHRFRHRSGRGWQRSDQPVELTDLADLVGRTSVLERPDRSQLLDHPGEEVGDLVRVLGEDPAPDRHRAGQDPVPGRVRR